MSFGKNIQFLRKIHNGITQEELAEIIGVSRQTVSKWELDIAYPEIEKVINLCEFFSCSMDQLMRENMDTNNEAYSNIRVENVEAFSYIKYAVVSMNPEDDAKNHIINWASRNEIINPNIIGWDFPNVSQEQVNVYHMHGYVAACILPKDLKTEINDYEIANQKEGKYATITVKNPFKDPFVLIPNAYKTLMRYIEVNGYKHKEQKDKISCYEKEYILDGIDYMDIYILID